MAAGTKGDRVKVWLSAPLSPPHHLSPRFLSIPPFLLFYPFPPYSHFLSLLSLSFLLLAPFLGSSLFLYFSSLHHLLPSLLIPFDFFSFNRARFILICFFHYLLFFCPPHSAPGSGPMFRSTTVAVEPANQTRPDIVQNWADIHTSSTTRGTSKHSYLL